jgi:pyruvate kinase
MDAHMNEVIEPSVHDDSTLGCGTKVVVTIGPASQSVDVMCQLLAHGMSCARLDLTWGSIAFHKTTLKNLAMAMRRTKKLCAVWVDTSGREIIVERRTTVDESGWVALDKTPFDFVKGATVTLTTKSVEDATPSLLPVNIKQLPKLVRPGQHLQVGRFMATGAEGGSLFLQVTSVSEEDITCVAMNDASLVGLLTVIVSHREYELTHHSQDLNVELPLFTQGDLEYLKEFGKEFELDYVSLSYCNSAADITEARETLDRMGLDQTKIIAKVERKAAIHNYEEIIALADGILLSRGNLGIDFEPEEMAHLQKKCIIRCNAIARPIILTRFVDTMVNTPRPTRAEATDVANAVLDGVDGVMLGAETLRGLYPVETVDTVSKLCRSAEQYFDYRSHHEDLMGEAFDEELSLERSFYSTNSLSDLTADSFSHMQSLKPILVEQLEKKHDDDLGSPSVLDSDVDGVTKVSSFGLLPITRGSSDAQLLKIEDFGAPYMSKVESIASSAVRTAEKINAGLIIVFAQSGRTASLVSKYRPPMPVVSVVVPTLQSDKLGWKLEGKYLARQCLIMRGITPLMAAPMSAGGSGLLCEAVAAACAQGLVKPMDYAVAILSEHGNFVVKVVKVDAEGTGIMSFGEKYLQPEEEQLMTLPSFATPPTSPGATDTGGASSLK